MHRTEASKRSAKRIQSHETRSACPGPTCIAVLQTDLPRAHAARAPGVHRSGRKDAMKKGLVAVLCVLAAGCSTRGQVNPDVMQIATAPLTCSTKAECDT